MIFEVRSNRVVGGLHTYWDVVLMLNCLPFDVNIKRLETEAQATALAVALQALVDDPPSPGDLKPVYMHPGVMTCMWVHDEGCDAEATEPYGFCAAHSEAYKKFVQQALDERGL